MNAPQRKAEPASGVLPTARAVPLESTVQSAVVDALRRLGCLVLVHSGGQRGRGFVRGALGRGAPDLFVLCDGQVILIESKRPKGGIVSDAQHEWHSEWRRHGGRVEVVCNVEGAIALVLEIRQGRRR